MQCTKVWELVDLCALFWVWGLVVWLASLGVLFTEPFETSSRLACGNLRFKCTTLWSSDRKQDDVAAVNVRLTWGYAFNVPALFVVFPKGSYI